MKRGILFYFLLFAEYASLVSLLNRHLLRIQVKLCLKLTKRINAHFLLPPSIFILQYAAVKTFEIR